MRRLRLNRQQLRLAAASAGVLLSALLSGAAGAWLESGHNSQPSLASQKKIVSDQSRLISQIAKRVGPSVVSVNVAISSQSPADFLGFAQPGQEQASGTQPGAEAGKKDGGNVVDAEFTEVKDKKAG